MPQESVAGNESRVNLREDNVKTILQPYLYDTIFIFKLMRPFILLQNYISIIYFSYN